MCCFSRQVRSVSATQVFARPHADGRQSLAYAMRYQADEPLALVLPIPVAEGAGEDAVEWIDLQGCPGLFDQLGQAFAEPPTRGGARRGAVPMLAVAQVGSFEASFAPSAAALARLDPRFSLPPSVVAALPALEGRGFVVARLRPDATKIHPLGFTFPRRDPTRAFFPTLHVHDGRVHATAEFDHTLYLQTDSPRSSAPRPPGLPGRGWQEPHRPVESVLDVGATAGLLRAGWPLWRLTLRGTLRNQDLEV